MKPDISRRAGRVWSSLRFKTDEGRLEGVEAVEKAAVWSDLPEWLRRGIESAERGGIVDVDR